MRRLSALRITHIWATETFDKDLTGGESVFCRISFSLLFWAKFREPWFEGLKNLSGSVFLCVTSPVLPHLNHLFFSPLPASLTCFISSHLVYLRHFTCLTSPESPVFHTFHCLVHLLHLLSSSLFFHLICLTSPISPLFFLTITCLTHLLHLTSSSLPSLPHLFYPLPQLPYLATFI